jgi:Berberine and berberine like
MAVPDSAARSDARRAGTSAAYRAALSLYAGELLPENRYDDWATVRRDELAELAAELADVALKDEYDPTNIFRLNQNIEPN